MDFTENSSRFGARLRISICIRVAKKSETTRNRPVIGCEIYQPLLFSVASLTQM